MAVTGSKKKTPIINGVESHRIEIIATTTIGITVVMFEKLKVARVTNLIIAVTSLSEPDR